MSEQEVTAFLQGLAPEEVACNPRIPVGKYYELANLHLDQGFAAGQQPHDFEQKRLAYTHFMTFANLVMTAIAQHPGRDCSSAVDRRATAALPKIIGQMEKWKTELKDNFVRERQTAAAVAAVPPAALAAPPVVVAMVVVPVPTAVAPVTVVAAPVPAALSEASARAVVKLPGGRVLSVPAAQTTLVSEVLVRLSTAAAAIGMETEAQEVMTGGRLIFAGRVLEPETSLGDYNIDQESELFLQLRKAPAATTAAAPALAPVAEVQAGEAEVVAPSVAAAPVPITVKSLCGLSAKIDHTQCDSECDTANALKMAFELGAFPSRAATALELHRTAVCEPRPTSLVELGS